MLKTDTMNFQAYLEDAWKLIKQEPVIVILGGLIVQLLTILTMGILAGPFLGGYFLLIILFLRDNKKPSFNDIFAGLQQFGNLFPYFLVLLVIFIGFMLLILPGFLFATWWIYVLPLMVDRKLSYSEAMRVSMNRVNETGFLMHLVFLLLISIIPILLLNFISAIIPFLFVLKLLLPPFQAGCLASLYIDQFREIEDKSTQQEKSPATETPVTPPVEKAAAAEQIAAEPADQDQGPGQPEKNENNSGEQQEAGTGPDSEDNIAESPREQGKSDIDTL